MRLGDLDALKSEFEWLLSQVSESSKDEVRDVIERIDNAPTVDAVEVVRCKECKHYFHYGRTSVVHRGKNIKAGWCQRGMRCGEEHRMLPNDFCSYGERRNDG